MVQYKQDKCFSILRIQQLQLKKSLKGLTKALN